MVLSVCKSTYLFFALFLVFHLSSCAQKHNTNVVLTAADQTASHLHLLKGKKIVVVANQTSVISNKRNFNTHKKSNVNKEYVHLIDSLLSLGIHIKKVFAPEHGFRGKADAGELVEDGIDHATGLPIISLYGKNKKPSKEQLKDIDLVLFDIQDVGTRFYTYISTLHYVMEACSESDIPLVVLDRPNPNGHYIDGPVLTKEHQSFVGMHPVPVVYGMTIGEYARMINGERWLSDGIKAKLTVIPLKNYTHQTRYSLPIKPSPNLPNDQAINLYPSLCFFEGTNVSAGRGTDMQFQIYGSPYLSNNLTFSFNPSPNQGAKYPKHSYMICYGEDLRKTPRLNTLNLSWLIKAYEQNTTKNFFNQFFTKLAGTNKLQSQLERRLTEKAIKQSWKEALDQFKLIRKNYLIYQ